MKLNVILKTDTFRHSTVTSISTLINAGLGALFYFILAYLLGAHDYGIFTLVASLITLIFGVVDLGSDQGIVKFIPRYKVNPKKQMVFMKLTLKVKLISGLLTLILLLFTKAFISGTILKQPDFEAYVPLVGLGVITHLLFSYSTSLSQALEKYFLWGGLYITTNFFRLLFIILFFILNILDSFSASVLYMLFPLLGFLSSLIFFERDFLSSRTNIKHLKELFDFNKWVIAFVIVATVGARLELFFTTRYLGFALVGVYGLIQQVSTILTQLTSAIGAVTSPRFASFTQDKQNQEYTLKALMLTFAVGILAFVFLIPFGYLVLKLAGNEYLLGFIPMIISLGALLIFLVTAPVRDSIIYYFSKPQFFFWTGIGHAVLITILSISLIPKYSLIGTSMTVLIGQVFIAICSVIYFFSLSRKT